MVDLERRKVSFFFFLIEIRPDCTAGDRREKHGGVMDKPGAAADSDPAFSDPVGRHPKRELDARKQQRSRFIGRLRLPQRPHRQCVTAFRETRVMCIRFGPTLCCGYQKFGENPAAAR